MNLLNKNIHDIKFSDVVDFCKEKILEGTQLDYKRNTPKDLAKHFATFSNTQGGLIIIGVGEDAKGLPTTYDGVANDGKLVDQVHQFAANVTPLPTYDVCVTDESKGNVFVLVRINEGAATPYTTLNDPTVWIRNGNISTPASRDELLRLANKRHDAEVQRDANLDFAQKYFDARLKDAEEERKNLIKAEKPGVYSYALNGEHCVVLTIALQPYYPKEPLTSPQDLLSRQHEYCGNEYQNTTFNYVPTTSMPGGLTAFSWNETTGHVRNDQQYANGLCFTASDVLTHNGTQSLIRMYTVSAKLYSELKLIQAYYKLIGYSGLVEGIITLEGGVGVAIQPISSPKHSLFMPEPGKVRLPSYKWRLHFDSNQLYDDAELSKIFGAAIRDVSWGLGMSDLPASILEGYLESNGFAPRTS